MIDIQNGLGLKNMSVLVRKEIHGIFLRLIILQKSKSKNTNVLYKK